MALRLDGSVPANKRSSIVRHFNDPQSPFAILLLSARAGGVGLNLVGANRIFLFEPDWNPATDSQAMGRVYREGQLKPVWIYRLVTKDTLEESIFKRQSQKQQLATVLEPLPLIQSTSSSHLEDADAVTVEESECESGAGEDAIDVSQLDFIERAITGAVGSASESTEKGRKRGFVADQGDPLASLTTASGIRSLLGSMALERGEPDREIPTAQSSSVDTTDPIISTCGYTRILKISPHLDN